jgi:dihydroorotase
LTDECLHSYDSNFKVLPPLRTSADVEAIIEGIRDGTIDVIASDHAPHANEKKQREFGLTPFGVIGMETVLPICITTLIETCRLTWLQLLEKLTIRPAEVLSVKKGTLKPGQDADVTIIDPTVAWTIDSDRFLSKSRNTPFAGRKVRGKAVTVIVGGQVKYSA